MCSRRDPLRENRRRRCPLGRKPSRFSTKRGNRGKKHGARRTQRAAAIMFVPRSVATSSPRAREPGVCRAPLRSAIMGRNKLKSFLRRVRPVAACAHGAARAPAPTAAYLGSLLLAAERPDTAGHQQGDHGEHQERTPVLREPKQHIPITLSEAHALTEAVRRLDSR